MRCGSSVAAVVTALALLTGCYTVEKGFRYEYDGRVYRTDGKTPVKGVSVRLARAEVVDAAAAAATSRPTGPVSVYKVHKEPSEPVDKSSKTKTRADGKYVGVLETVKGWKYSEGWGLHSGPTKAPEPPLLDDVIVYVQEKGAPTTGYRVKVPAEAQGEAISGVRKVHVPDLLIPYPSTTRGTTRATTEPVQ